MKTRALVTSLTFWISAAVSMLHPIAQRTTPTMSAAVPHCGFIPPSAGSETAGELRMVSGRETVQTQTICPV